MSICPAPVELPPELPAYAPALAAYHRAYERELRVMVGDLSISPGSTVLDLACGDGAYLDLLATSDRTTTVTGVDVDENFLEVAQKKCHEGTRMSVIKADAAALPFDDESIDLVWCAQSFYSLPDPRLALREVRRVLRNGGRVAIFENDTLHHMLAPWPVDLEIALRQAEYEAFQKESEDPKRFYVARNLPKLCRKSGLTPLSVRTYAHNRWFPFTDDERTFFYWYFNKLKDRVQPYLPSHFTDHLDRLIDPQSDSSMLNLVDTVITCLDHVIVAEKATISGV